MTTRLTYLREQYGARLLDAFMADDRNAAFADIFTYADGKPMTLTADAIEALFSRYRDADPTRTGACTQWLMRLAIAGRLPAEDLPKARETLEAFLVYKRRLPVDQRDLCRYETLGTIWTVVEPFVLENAPTSGKDEARREREEARTESDILLEQDGWTVAIPRTERAAKWWGRGTRWCTAADRLNMFANYNSRAPLVVFIRPDGEKFQFHAQSQSFMDARDEPVEAKTALNGLPTGDPVDAGMAGLHAALFPTQVHEERNYVYAVSDYGLRLHRVPYQAMTHSLCLAAVMRNGRDLGAIPGDLIDQEICDVAVRSHPKEAFDRVPERFITRTICLDALGGDYAVLKRIPEPLRDREICLAAVRRFGMMLEAVPLPLRDREMCLEAVKWSGYALLYVPDTVRDRDICLEAMRNGGPLHDVPVDLRDKEICQAAVLANSIALRETPEHLIDKEMCLGAVRRYGLCLDSVPDRFRDWDVCLEAVEQNSVALCCVPKRLESVEFFAEALRRNSAVADRLSPEWLEKIAAYEAQQATYGINDFGASVNGATEHEEAAMPVQA